MAAMADFDLMELATDQLEDDGIMTPQQVLTAAATATAVITTIPGEATVLVEATKQIQTTTSTVNITQSAANHGNGNSVPEPKEGDQPAVSFGDGAALVGRSVVKKFNRKKYAGQVAGFDPETKWYKVVYEDGDEEELEYKELEPILAEAEAAALVKAANFKKRPAAQMDTDAKSPAKKARGRKPAAEKSPGNAKTEKAKSPKASTTKSKQEKPAKAKSTPKKGKSEEDKQATAATGEDKENKQATGEVSETQSTEKKKAVAPTTPKGQKAGEKKSIRGRPKKEESLKSQLKAKTGKKRKVDGKGSGDSSSESKPSTRKTSSTQDQDDSKSGRSPRAKTGTASSPGVLAFQAEGVNLIGRKTKKKFGIKIYSGEVIGFDPKVKFYKVQYEDGDIEELDLKQIKKTLVTEEGQSTPSKTKVQATKDAASPAKAAEDSPQKKQKVTTPKKGDAKTQSPARDGAQPKKRGRPAKSVSEKSDEDKASDEDSEEDHSGISRDEGSTLVASTRPCPASAPLAAVRFASASNAQSLEYYGWGEVVHSNRSRCTELTATNLMPTSSPIVHLAASHHHLAALTAAGQVLVWRNQHGNVHTRCDEWEHVSDLESKGVVLIDIRGPDIDRRSAGYEAMQEDQVPDPFYLAAVCDNGEDYLFQGSQAQEYVHTQRLRDAPKIKGLRSTLSQTNLSGLKGLGQVVQASVGTVEALDETPFVGLVNLSKSSVISFQSAQSAMKGLKVAQPLAACVRVFPVRLDSTTCVAVRYITDTDRVYMRSATKIFMDEINLVNGYTGKPLKIQCGGVYHAIILTDDGRAWTWGRGYFPASAVDSSCSSSGDQSPYSICHPALGTLVGRKVVDVGCYGEDFVALTSDGIVHQWTHSVPNPAAGIYNTPSTPTAGQGPSIPHGDKLKSISIGVGVCAGVTELGKVHTWRTFWRGALVGVQGPGTPLGRDTGRDTVLPSLGAKVATKVMCVAGSLIVVAEKKAKAKPRLRKIVPITS